MLGCTSHNFKERTYDLVLNTGPFRYCAYSDVVILSPCRKLVCLANVVLLHNWSRFLESHWLEIARGDGFTVMPSDFQSTNTHFKIYFGVCKMARWVDYATGE